MRKTLIYSSKAALFIFAEIALAQPVITQGPVVDVMSYSSARITWITDRPSSTVIKFGLTSSYDGVTTGASNVTTHSWYLSGLASATTYHFQVCSSAGSEVCSKDTVFTTHQRQVTGDPAGPIRPKVTVNTQMPAGPYGAPFIIDPACSNLPEVLDRIAKLSGGLNYEIQIPAGTVCRGQSVFPNRPNHTGWIVVRPMGTLPPEGTRVSPDWSPQMATFLTNALPATQLSLTYLPGYCSPDALFWATDAPGMALLECKRMSSSGSKTITDGTHSGSASPVILTVPGHGYMSGNVVKVTGTGLGVDNRSWVITVLDSDHFSLDGSRGSGRFSGQGIADRNDTWTRVTHGSGTSLPTGCSPNDWFFRTDISPNTEAAFWCTAPNQWTQVKAINTADGRSYAAIQFEDNASRYRFIGLEVTHNPVPNPPPAGWKERDFKQGVVGSLVFTRETNSHITFDRCDIHGLDYPARLAHGLDLNGSHVALIHSRVHKVNRWLEPVSNAGNLEGIAINIGDGPGPGKIENNFLEAIGITIFFPDNSYHDTPPADYEIRRNHISHPEKYLYGSPLNTSGKNYMNRHLLELKRGRRMLVEGNIFDGNWMDINQGAFVALTPRPGWLPPVKAITRVQNGVVTVSSGSDPYQPWMLVSITGTGAANHDGIWRVASVLSPTTFTLADPPSGYGTTGRSIAVGSDVQIADIDFRSNVFRNGTNVLLVTGHQEGTSSMPLNTRVTARIRLENNLIYGMNARSLSAGGRVSPISYSTGGRSGIVAFISRGMQDLTIRNNTIYDFKGNLPSLLAFDSTAFGANAGLNVRNNIFTASAPMIGHISGNYVGKESFNRQWTLHPNPSWIVEGNVFCCNVSSVVQERNPPGNSWAQDHHSIGFQSPETGDFRLVPSSRFRAGTSDGRDPGVNMDELKAATQ